MRGRVPLDKARGMSRRSVRPLTSGLVHPVPGNPGAAPLLGSRPELIGTVGLGSNLGNHLDMMKTLRILILFLVAGLCGPVQAGQPGYAETLRLKLGSGIANMLTGWVEVPKNMLNTTNQSGNIFLGIGGGGGKGLLHMLARTLSGVVDFITFPVPTRPIPDPPVVWERFYTDTRYGPYFTDVRSNPYPAKPTGKAPAPVQQTPPPAGMSGGSAGY